MYGRHLSTGLIIMGYQGIGKTTLTKKYENIIDLESSNFKIDNERFDDWEDVYCKTALNLAKQGNIVFTSTHEAVLSKFTMLRNQFEYCHVVSISPDKALKDAWINKLAKRYNNTQLDKDKRAYEDAIANYDAEIDFLAHNGQFTHIFIDNIDYDLGQMVSGLCKIYSVPPLFQRTNSSSRIDTVAD